MQRSRSRARWALSLLGLFACSSRPVAPEAAPRVAVDGPPATLAASATPLGEPRVSGSARAVVAAVEPRDSATPSGAVATAPRVALLRYRERFTGLLPGGTTSYDWALELYADHTALVQTEVTVGPRISLEVGHDESPAPGSSTSIEVVSKQSLGATWTGALDQPLTVTLDRAPADPIRCEPETVSVLPAGARILASYGAVRKASWTLGGSRKKTTALGCSRAGIAEPAEWQNEPQPERLLFTENLDAEYVHENSSDTVQLGGLRQAPHR